MSRPYREFEEPLSRKPGKADVVVNLEAEQRRLAKKVDRSRENRRLQREERIAADKANNRVCASCRVVSIAGKKRSAIYCDAEKCRKQGSRGQKKTEHERFMARVRRAKPFLVETPLLPVEAAQLARLANRGHALSPEQTIHLVVNYLGLSTAE
jgi:hypothetical protein